MNRWKFQNKLEEGSIKKYREAERDDKMRAERI
jgi:hypothetical protein